MAISKNKPVNDSVKKFHGLPTDSSDLPILFFIAIGFLIRAIISTNGFNPDESAQYLISNKSTLLSVYRQNLASSPHPPFFSIFLHLWRYLGNSEWILRFPGVAAGTAAIFVGFKWLERAIDKTTAKIGLVLVAFSPSMVFLSADLRDYVFLILFIFCSLFFLECAFEKHSIRLLLISSLFLALAILTDYAVFWASLALGAWGSVKILRNNESKNFIGAWFAIQSAIVCLYIVLYLTQISKISIQKQDYVDGWYRWYFFHPGKERLLGFLYTHTCDVFHYFFPFEPLRAAVPLLFLVGTASLLLDPHRSRRELGFLLLLVFVLGASAGVFGFFPYGETRHVSYLLPFAVAGVSASLARLKAKSPWITPFVMSVLILGWAVKITGKEMTSIKMGHKVKAAIEFIRGAIPPDGIFIVDTDMNHELSYYLARNSQFPDPQLLNDSAAIFAYGGYRIATSWPPTYHYNPDTFKSTLDAALSKHHPGRSRTLRAVVLSEYDLPGQLKSRFPGLVHSGVQTFGPIDTFEVSTK